MVTHIDLEAELEEIRRAAVRLAPYIRETPTVYSYTFSESSGGDVHLKLENLQRTGSFKVRGALNMILQLTEEQRSRGLVAASAGNHAQGVALAAQLAGCTAKIVMPISTAITKVERTRGYGAEVVLHGASYDEAAARALELVEHEGRTPVHPFDDWEVIRGQGTVGIELLRQVPDLVRGDKEGAAVTERTEAHGAANNGANEAAKELGVAYMREWIAAADKRTRQSHIDAEVQRVGPDEPFIVGGAALMYPGDPNAPPEETINCRCGVGFVVD